MVRQLVSWTILGTGLVLATGAYAQGYGDRYYRNDPYSRNDPYRGDGGYGRQARGSSLDRVRADLERAAGDSFYLNGHERHHFRKALDELGKFESKLYRGKWDNGAIDRAIGNLSHLVEADQVRPRDRQVLNNDLFALREFRANRGEGYGRRY